MQFTTKLFFLILMFGGLNIFAQGTAINTSGNTADNSSILDVSSTTQGILVPRMSATERGNIGSPATGLVVYQTDGTAGFYYNSGTPGAPVWVILLNGSSSLNAANLTGTVNTARLGSGTANSGTFLRGDNTWTTTGGGSQTVTVLDASSATSFDCSNTSVAIWVLDTNGRNGSGVTLNITMPRADAVTAGTIFRYAVSAYVTAAPTIALKSPGSTYNAATFNDLDISSSFVSISSIALNALVSDGVSKWFKLQ